MRFYERLWILRRNGSSWPGELSQSIETAERHKSYITLVDQPEPIHKGIRQESCTKEDNQESYRPRILIRTKKRNSANPYE